MQIASCREALIFFQNKTVDALATRLRIIDAIDMLALKTVGLELNLDGNPVGENNRSK